MVTKGMEWMNIKCLLIPNHQYVRNPLREHRNEVDQNKVKKITVLNHKDELRVNNNER